MCAGKSNCTCGCSPMFKAEQEPLIVELPVLIKSVVQKGKDRIIDFEASCAASDSEGDVIEQKALLDSAAYFVEKGFIDIDHYCELGRNPAYAHVLNIARPEEWIVGKPLDVYDLGNYRTGVKAQIFANPTGKVEPGTYKYDWVWQQLQKAPHEWKASVYGYPGADTMDGGCTIGTNGRVCASRYLVKSFRWHSTALTRSPVNKAIQHSVRIISAKAFAAKFALAHSMGQPQMFTRDAIVKSYLTHMKHSCPETNNGSNVSVHTIRGHFFNCENLPFYLSDMYSLATAELIRRL